MYFLNQHSHTLTTTDITHFFANHLTLAHLIMAPDSHLPKPHSAPGQPPLEGPQHRPPQTTHFLCHALSHGTFFSPAKATQRPRADATGGATALPTIWKSALLCCFTRLQVKNTYANTNHWQLAWARAPFYAASHDCK